MNLQNFLASVSTRPHFFCNIGLLFFLNDHLFYFCFVFQSAIYICLRINFLTGQLGPDLKTVFAFPFSNGFSYLALHSLVVYCTKTHCNHQCFFRIMIFGLSRLFIVLFSFPLYPFARLFYFHTHGTQIGLNLTIRDPQEAKLHVQHFQLVFYVIILILTFTE